MLNLISIGDVLIDTHVFIDNATVECDINQQNCQLCLNYASKIPITHSFQALGGNAANVAVGGVRLGLSTGILSSICNDATGDMVQEQLKKQKVNTKLVSINRTVPTRYSVVLNFKEERTILSYHQRRSYKFPKKLPKTDWVYYSSLSEGYENFQEKLLSYLKKNTSIRLAYNPGSIQLKNKELVKKVVAQTDILIVNLEEARTIVGTDFTENQNIPALIEGLLRMGAREVAITDSARGAWAGNKENLWHCNSFPVPVISKTGAGDAFSAGYIAARFYKKNIETAIHWGIAASSHIITADATKKIAPNKKEIFKIISESPSIKPTRII